MQNWKNISLWMDQIDDSLEPRPTLDQNITADVCIIGAGYTGLWTAYYLKQHAPELKVVILEAQTAGFGASGRNGGWLIGALNGQDALLSNINETERYQCHTLLHDIPNEVASVIEKEAIDCDYQKGGMLIIAARYKEQNKRLKSYLDELNNLGYLPEDNLWLDKKGLDSKIQIPSAEAAIFNPHCASVHPAKLVRGLATACEKLGVKIYEQSKVIQWHKGLVKTEHYQVQSTWVVPSIEGYSATLLQSLKPLKKVHLPVQSLIVATEPLSDETWSGIGLSCGETFSDFSRQVTYAMRTKDNRLVMGARGGYQFGGKLRHNFDLSEAEINFRRNLIIKLFPQLKDVKITHAWGGNLSMARNFHPHMLIDAENQYAFSGGYGGEGVGASNLAGRTLADLILQRDSELVRKPWVVTTGDFNSIRRWETEPIPWVGYNLIAKTFDWEDRVLSNKSSPAWQRYTIVKLADFMERFLS